MNSIRNYSRSRVYPALLALAALLALVPAAPLAAQSAEVEYEGASALGLSLRRLGATQRVLMVAAHPDDENTAVLAALALGAGADVAYLSLTRGEGGQNGIGSELQEALGMIRSEELLAARRLDGARQFFTRAYDYGFSKSADEAFQHWPRDSILADAVAVIRQYRPDLVITIFSGTPADGHGQHQAAGIVAREAFAAAGDPARFPEQIVQGLRPHHPARLYQASWRGGGAGGVPLQTGTFDPLLGRSYHQIALASRGRHRSQDMGRALVPGPQQVILRRVDREEAPMGSIFAGLDTTLSARARTLIGNTLPAASAGRSASPLDSLQRLLTEYDAAIPTIRAAFTPLAPGALAPRLARLVGLLEDATMLTSRLLGSGRGAMVAGGSGSVAGSTGASGAIGAPPIMDLHFHLAAELDDTRAALAHAAGIVLDAVATAERIIPGQRFEVELTIWNGGAYPVAIESLDPTLPKGWRSAIIEPGDGAGAGGGPNGARAGTAGNTLPKSHSGGQAGAAAVTLEPGTLLMRRFEVRVPEDAVVTEPYFLRDERAGDIYRWPADHTLRGLPFEAPALQMTARLAVAGTSLELGREIQFRAVSTTEGESRRPVMVTPAISVALHPAVAVLPTGKGGTDKAAQPAGRATERSKTSTPTGAPTLRFSVQLESAAASGIAGNLRLAVPHGWIATPATVAVHLGGTGERRQFDFSVTPPTGATPGAFPLRAVFETEAGARYERGYDLVDYPHIRPRPLYREAVATVQLFDVQVAAGLRVAYIPGAGDAIPDALAQLGVPVTIIDPEDLATADLAPFQTVVLGIRAYEHQPELARQNRRLLEYVERGGTLIVQYNQYRYSGGGFAPYPLTIGRPHDRVTDELAPVQLLAPSHPALSWPNRIGAADFEGWVQERGLYFARSWDERYTPLLAMSDPGDEPLRGGLLISSYGKGTYVYTGLALFRQLPAGVPGAYRLLANLISLGARE
jgi:LmbE family N-acetylglucosaminyl deacetylase